MIAATVRAAQTLAELPMAPITGPAEASPKAPACLSTHELAPVKELCLTELRVDQPSAKTERQNRPDATEMRRDERGP
jgi:hypothetical protein